MLKDFFADEKGRSHTMAVALEMALDATEKAVAKGQDQVRNWMCPTRVSRSGVSGTGPG
jgi:hypothetical protein